MSNILSLIIPFVLLALFMGTAVTLAVKSNKRLKSITTSYATEHGWRYDTPSPDIPFFQQLKGYSNKDKTFIEGKIGGYHFWLYGFLSGIGGGPGNRLMSHYLSINLSFNLPTTLLGPRSVSAVTNPLARINDSLVQLNNNLVPLKLEGDADNRFSVMVEKGQEAISLQYLTPDLLNVLEQQVKSTVVLSGNFVSINAGVVAAVKNEQALNELFAGAEALLKTLPPQPPST